MFAFILSMPGVPFIYYGDEIGMKYVDNLVSVEGGYGRTGSRSPMQWDGTINAGFGLSSPEKLYIPIDPDENRPTVEKSIADENSIYHEVKRLISLRKAHPALSNKGDVRFVYVERDSYPIAYMRAGEGGESACCHKSLGKGRVVCLRPRSEEGDFPLWRGDRFRRRQMHNSAAVGCNA